MRKTAIFTLLMACVSLGAQAQYFLTDTARLNRAYDRLMEQPDEKGYQQEFFEAFPDSWARYINLYDYVDRDGYDLSMYYAADKHVGAMQDRMTLIPDSTYCKKIVGVAVGARLDADAPNYLQRLLHHVLATRAKAVLDYLSSLKSGAQFEFWEFYWSSISHEKSLDKEFEDLYNKYHNDYPETMEIMANAHQYFCGGVDFAADPLCPKDDSTRCACTHIDMSKEVTTYKISTLVAAALLLILVVIFLWQRKMLFRMIQSHRKKLAYKVGYELTDRFITDNERELETLRKRHEEEKDEGLRARLEWRQRKLADTIENAKLRAEEQAMARQLLHDSAVCQRVTTAESLTEDDWAQLDKEVTTLFPGFRERIEEACKISEHEYRVDLLIKTGAAVSRIATLTFCSASSVSKCRQRQYERAFGTKGRPEEWDTFLHCL